MTAAPPITVSPDPPSAAGAAARAMIEGQVVMLAELAEIGMDMARAAGRGARALAEGGAGGDRGAVGLDPALSYVRAARAVRLTIALQSKLAKDLAALEQAGSRARAADAARRRDRIHRKVEQIIEAERDDADEAEQLSSGVWERLTDADESAILDRPIDEVVAQICQDLGLSPVLAAQAWAVPAFTAPDGAAPDDAPPAEFGPERVAPLIPVGATAPFAGMNSS